MAIYTLKPLTAAQIRRRRHAYLLVLLISVAILIATVAAWMNFIIQPDIRGTLFTLSIVAVVAAMVAAFGLWNFQDLIRVWGRSAYEVAHQGVRFYKAGLRGSEPMQLGLSPSDTAPSRSGGEICFLPLDRIRDFEVGPSGAILVHGRLSSGTIRIPATLEDAEGFRQELRALGLPEAQHSRFAWYVRLTAKWIAILLLLLAISYMFWGSNLWAVLACGVLYAAFMAWGSWVAHRFHEHESQPLSQSLLFVFVAAMVLLMAGQRAWRLEHPRVDRSVTTTVTSSLW